MALSAEGILQYNCLSYSKGKGEPTPCQHNNGQLLMTPLSVLLNATFKAMNTIKFQIQTF